ncbi:fluoride efflux transporter CrcB [Oceanicella sp. SM1341]|uniref:fluoride efflux transporter CrcB n=1 Tax=Oceanicella sp. SM1341 TaxID=1548889 RepID=UPI001E51482C|nr:fluoride efflux transporter CrcB [Oceanicella sp. SM1341]
MILLQVALGGAIGATLRYLTGSVLMRLFGTGFPYGTFFVNIVGSFAMGVLAVVLAERMPGGWARLSPLLMTGLLGGFTTFSAFSLDAIYLFERGRHALALFYVGGSVLLSMGGLMAGLALARMGTQ